MSAFLSGALRLPYILQLNSESRPDATGVPDNALVFNSFNGRLFLRPSSDARGVKGTSWIEPGIDLAINDRATFTSPLSLVLKDTPAQRFQTAGIVRLTACQVGRMFYLVNASGSTITLQSTDGTNHSTIRSLVTGEAVTVIRQAGFISGAIPKWEITSSTRPAASEVQGLGAAALLATDTDITLAANSDTLLATQKAVKAYVDNLVTGLAWKPAVRVATTANGTFATAFQDGSVVDGVTLVTGDRILLKNQTTATQNGIYRVNFGASPTRTTDADVGAELVNATVFVSEGTANADTQWTCTNNTTITIGSTSIAFAQVSGAGTYSAGTGLSLTGNQFAISDAELLAIAGLTSAADTGFYFNGAGTAATFALTSLARTLLGGSTNTAMRSTLGVVIGTNVQAWDADLDAIAALAPANDDFIQRKAGAWTNRTVAQVQTDLVAVGGLSIGLSLALSGANIQP
ncbi:MAG: hypothetical protein PSV22_14330 [Pseudolabrys sp.]|nr:hypothetical protein [Pseudolabrys sp.]